MRGMAKRLADMEASMGSGGKNVVIFAWVSWDKELVLDHYGRDKIGPNDEVMFFIWGDSHLSEPVPYPAGYFDPDGRWAKLCAERGIPHRDHAE